MHQQSQKLLSHVCCVHLHTECYRVYDRFSMMAILLLALILVQMRQRQQIT